MRKPTIYEALKAKLGREPTNRELNDEVKRILFGEGHRHSCSRGCCK